MAGIDIVLVNAGPGETRVALLAGDRLVELLVARGGADDVAGNVYLGRVRRVLPGIQAAFVDIGTGRAGFLAVAEARPAGAAGGDAIGDYVGEGDAVLVQAMDDPVADKGARLTTRLAVPGRYLVATPGEAGIRVSRRIEDEAERVGLAERVAALVGEGGGFIVRTSAGTADGPALERDIAYLGSVCDAIEAGRAAARAPALLVRELEPLCRVLRDQAGGTVGAIIVDEPRVLAQARAFCRRLSPEAEALLGGSEAGTDLFEAHGVEEQIEAALARRVELSSGGALTIEATAALIAIDVDSAGHTAGGPEETALAVNLEAAVEIAHQLRLRNLGGLIAVDFVSMRRRQNGARVLDTLRRAVANDACPTHVGGFTRLGLVEMTRQRRRAALADVLAAPRPAPALSPESMAYAALRRLGREASANPGAALELRCAPAVIEALRGPAAPALAALGERLARAPTLRADLGFAAQRIDVGVAGEEGNG